MKPTVLNTVTPHVQRRVLEIGSIAVLAVRERLRVWSEFSATYIVFVRERIISGLPDLLELGRVVEFKVCNTVVPIEASISNIGSICTDSTDGAGSWSINSYTNKYLQCSKCQEQVRLTHGQTVTLSSSVRASIFFNRIAESPFSL